MALTNGDVQFWRHLRARSILPPKPCVLEIGEANWHGDVAVEDCPEELPGEGLAKLSLDPVERSFGLAKLFYKTVLDYETINAIDLNGSPNGGAWRYDLNEPTAMTDDFDIVINSGTLEHVFNQHQAFKTVHDACRLGGLMVHAAPVLGWDDHCFYRYNKMFWEELAKANAYEMVAFFLCPYDWTRTMSYYCFQKYREGPFVCPMQGHMYGLQPKAVP